LLEKIFSLFGSDLRSAINRTLFYLYSIDEESLTRHPMGFFEKGQLEFLCNMWLWIGPAQQFFVPHTGYFRRFATLSEVDPSLTQRADELRDLIFRKVLFRRGKTSEGTLHVLMKTHSSDCIPHLIHRYPDAKFVFCHRLPSAQLSSCFGLFESTAKSRIGLHYSVLTQDWISARMEWLQKMWNAELAIFVDRIPPHLSHDAVAISSSIPPSQRISIRFDSFIRNFEPTMVDVFSFLGHNLATDDYLSSALKTQSEAHHAYKVGRKYDNPSLNDLGLDGKVIDEKNLVYIKTFLSDDKL
jgi:hypothetical protein